MPCVVARSFLFVTWAGGGNVGPFLCLAGLLRSRGHDVRAVATAGLEARFAEVGVDGRADRRRVAARWRRRRRRRRPASARRPRRRLHADRRPRGRRAGRPAHGRPRPHPLPRAARGRRARTRSAWPGRSTPSTPPGSPPGCPPLASLADLLAAVDRVLVAAPRSLDAPGAVPDHVVYAGPLLEGPGPDEGWAPPTGSGPLVVVSLGTSGDPKIEAAVLGRIVDGLAVAAGARVRHPPRLPRPARTSALPRPTSPGRATSGTRRCCRTPTCS